MKPKKKEKKHITSGIIHIQSSFNNTIVTASDLQGNALAWSSAGACGYKGAKKGTPFAAQQAASTVARKIAEYGMRSVEVEVSGPGSGRETAIRALQSAGLRVTILRDVTPIPHNGCRASKRRRV